MGKKHSAICTLSLLLLVLAQNSNAQFSVGLEGGYDKNYFITNTSALNSAQYNPMSGFSVNIPVTYDIADWFAIKSGLGYMQKNNQYARTGFYQGVYQNNTNSYVQLPVMGHFSFGGDDVRGFVDLGGYAGYWASSYITGRQPLPLVNPAYTNNTSNEAPNNVFDEYSSYSYSEKYTFNTTKDRRLELGVTAGVGISYKITDTYQIFGEASYYESLTDQQKNYEQEQVPRYNQTYVFSLGVMYSFGGGGKQLY